MLFRTHIVSTRTLLQLTVATIFSVAAVGVAFAANGGYPPLLVPYTVQTVAGTPQYTGTAVPVGYFGEGVPSTTSLAHQTGAAVLNGPYAIAVDSVGNLYINDTANFIIREVNAQTGLINTIAGVIPKGCTGSTCTVRVSGCADGVPAAGAPIGAKNEGIALDAYGNVYFADATSASVSVIYRGGTQVANFIKLENPAGVIKSGGTVMPGYVYHIAGAINLTTCAGTKGNVDNGLAFTNTGTGIAPSASIATPPQTLLVTLDSAGNLYIGDSGNATVRVINTQATAQTFFQYTVQPGYMRSITNCSSLLTTACPIAPTTLVLNTGINGPVNALVYSSQYRASETDAYGNIYQLNGTAGGTGFPGIYSATTYAGGAPLANLLTAEAPMLAGTYGPNSSSPGNTPAELPLTYGYSYDTIDNVTISSGLNLPVDILPLQSGAIDVRSSSFLPDNFGTFWFMDNHYPELDRIDQYTSLATLILTNKRATANLGLLNSSPASFANPYYCVYGNTTTKIAWTQGPQTYDPQGDGCPAVVAYFTGGNYQTVSDGLANIYVGEAGEQLERELTNGNYFPSTAVGTAAPVTQAIQVHFNSNNPPPIGVSIPDGAATGNVTTAFSIAPGISDFTINTTTPEFPMGSLVGSSGYANTTTTANFQMWSGLPTCTQLGLFPNATPVTDYDCLVYVTFNPSAPGVRQSQLVVTTANGSIYNFALYGTGTGSQLAIDGGAAAPVAATGLGTTAGIAVSQSGTVYIADPSNNRIVIEPAGGGGQSNLSFTGVTPASLSGPMGVAVDSSNNVYVSDTGNNRVLQVNQVTGVATVLGNNVWVSGSTCYSTSPAADCPTSIPTDANGNPTVTPTTAPPQYVFKQPQGLAVDKWNNVYVADTGNSAVVEITSNIALGGAVPLLNYPGAPKFSAPVAVAVDSQGNIYVVDAQAAGGAIIELPPGGGDLVNVPTAVFPKTIQAGLNSPSGITVDAAGNIYVSDNSSNVVVEKPSASGAGGTSFTLNFSGLSSPSGLALDASGNLYVSDSGNKQILFDNRQNPLINFGTVPQFLNPTAQPICADTIISDGSNIGNYGAGCPLTITNIGNQTVTLTPPVTNAVGAGNPAFTFTSTCFSTVSPGSTFALPAGSTCQIKAIFAPTADNGQSENVNVNGGPQVLHLTANGAQPLANVVLSAAYTGGTSTTTPTPGATATITATVTQPYIAGNTPTGTVTFTYTVDASNKNVNSCGAGGTQTVALSNGAASFALPVLAAGIQYTLTANYNGDTLNSAAQASPLAINVPGTPVTVTVTSTPAQLTFTFGGTPPVPVGTVSPTPPSGVTFQFGSNATARTPISTPTNQYPVTVSFSGAGSCAYGFPSADLSTGGQAFVTENPAPLTYTIPNFTAQYGALDITYGANPVITGAVNGDVPATFSGTTFVPAASSILNVGVHSVTPTVFSNDIGNYAVTAPPFTVTITQAPTSISVTPKQTAVLNTTSAVTGATYLISVLPSGKGTPSGTVTVMDYFTPITPTAAGLTTPTIPPCTELFTGSTTSGSAVITGVSSTFGLNQPGVAGPAGLMPITQTVSGAGIPASATISSVSGATVTLSASATATASGVLLSATNGIQVNGTLTCATPTTLPLVGGVATYIPTNPTATIPNTTPGINQYTFAYSGDSNFLSFTLAPAATAAACIPSAVTSNCLIVDYSDFTLTSNTGPVVVIPGTVPSGNGLLAAPNQSSAAPETAVLFVNAVLAFTGSVNVSCQTQNPSYVTCFMTPTTVCFIGTASAACANTSSTAATVVAVQTPATLPLGFKTSQMRISASKTMLAFLPFGVLAFCVRRRRRLSKSLWMLIAFAAIGAGMSGCGGNQVDFYTPIPTGPQTVTVTATYLGNGGTQPAATRQFVVPIAID